MQSKTTMKHHITSRNTLLGIYPKKLKTGSQRPGSTPVCIIVLYTTGKSRNNLSGHGSQIRKDNVTYTRWNTVHSFKRRKF